MQNKLRLETYSKCSLVVVVSTAFILSEYQLKCLVALSESRVLKCWKYNKFSNGPISAVFITNVWLRAGDKTTWFCWEEGYYRLTMKQTASDVKGRNSAYPHIQSPIYWTVLYNNNVRLFATYADTICTAKRRFMPAEVNKSYFKGIVWLR